MTEQDILRLRNSLLERRRELLDRVRSLEEGWQALADREIELEEEAQKVGISQAYDRLDQNGKEEIEQIDLALRKMVTGEYGVCESCGDDISIKRLEALAWTRLCVDCAREYERKRKTLPEKRETISSAKLPDEYQGLSNEQVLRMVFQRLRRDRRIQTEELDISVRKGVVFLEGTIPSEVEHQILLQILKDDLGFAAIVDRLRVREVIWEREELEAVSASRAGRGMTKERLLYDEEEMSDDIFEAEDEEITYTLPENPPPPPR